MKLLVDMNLSPAWVQHLRTSGFEAEHWSVTGAPSASDVEIMAYAREHGFVVLTHDLDFGAILAATQGEKPSVVQIRSDDVSPAAIGIRVVEGLRQATAELDSGGLLTVEPHRVRMRFLPLRWNES